MAHPHTLSCLKTEVRKEGKRNGAWGPPEQWLAPCGRARPERAVARSCTGQLQGCELSHQLGFAARGRARVRALFFSRSLLLSLTLFSLAASLLIVNNRQSGFVKNYCHRKLIGQAPRD
jgi:hypothetical protein